MARTCFKSTGPGTYECLQLLGRRAVTVVTELVAKRRHEAELKCKQMGAGQMLQPGSGQN